MCGNGFYSGSTGKFIRYSTGNRSVPAPGMVGDHFFATGLSASIRCHSGDHRAIQPWAPAPGRQADVLHLSCFCASIGIWVPAWPIGDEWSGCAVPSAYGMDRSLHGILRSHHITGLDQFWARLSQNHHSLGAPPHALLAGRGHGACAWKLSIPFIWFRRGSQFSLPVLVPGNCQ